METHKTFGLSKSERIHSRLAVESLFSDKKSSVAVYPLRVVWRVNEQPKDVTFPYVRILVSVPKKRFRHAVDRNRMKRQIREAFRLNKHLLSNHLIGSNRYIDIAFISIADRPAETSKVQKSVAKALLHVVDTL